MFTREEVVVEARRKYGKPVCLDFIDDAMSQPTLEEAVEIIVLDSFYWDESPNLSGGPP